MAEESSILPLGAPGDRALLGPRSPTLPFADEFFHHPFLEASATVKKCESPECLGAPRPRRGLAHS